MLETTELGIVADDLTGACDAAACFAPVNGAVGVCLSLTAESVGGPPLQVVNTQSRLAAPEQARRISCKLGAALAEKRVVFKKMDTGLRGPIGAELDGLLEGLKESGTDWLCVVAPAAPSIGRTTRSGVQYDNGVPVDRSALAADPSSPPLSAHVRTVLERTGHGDWLVCDAESQADIEWIIDAHWDKARIVFAGSLGLAAALTRRLRAPSCRPPTVAPAHRPMMVCGSCHPQSVRQVERSRGDGGVVLSFDVARNRFDEPAAPKPDGVPLARILPNDYQCSGCSSQQIMNTFVAALDPLFDTIKPDGLGIVGGETAYHVLRRLGVNRLQVIGQMDEVISCGVMADGLLEFRPFALKGGSVGPGNAVKRMIDYLKSGSMEKR